jgi:L-ascorbate metabolism protein UlaG (beta-lactamase superfamily)
MKTRCNLRFTGWTGFILILILAQGGSSQTFDFAHLQRLSNSEAVVTLHTPTNGNYDIQVSTNTIQWNTLLTALATSGSIQYTDSAAPFLPLRYYRGQQLEGTNAVTGDHIATDAGDIVIHKGYHASFAMSWSNMMIYVDPTNRFLELPRADLILLTHDHLDHYNTNVLMAVRGANGVLVAPNQIYTKPNFASLTPYTTMMTNGQTTTILGIGIEAVPMYNTGTSPPHVRGVGNGYVLTIGGKRIYISGDTVDVPEVLALRNIDVAFLAMNQPYTMTVAQAVNLVRNVVPKIVYPEHYKGNPITDLGSFKTQVMTNPRVEVRLRNWY